VIGSTLSDRAAVSNEGFKADASTVSGLNMTAARLSPGAISESNASHLPASEASQMANADPPHAVTLLRVRRERPSRRAAQRSDEFAPSKANAHLALLCLQGKK
jgi:hypothetical protein